MPLQQLTAIPGNAGPCQTRADVFAAVRPNSLQLFLAWIRLWCFGVVKFLIGVGYVAVIAEGLRIVVPALGMKLYKLPLLGTLKDYEGWHRLDLALFAGILLFALSSSIWCELLDRWLFSDSASEPSGPSTANYEKCLVIVGSVILIADACLFYRAMTFVGWGGGPFSFTALLCTLAYVAVLVAVCMTSVNLKRKYLSFKCGYDKQGVRA